MKCESCHKDLKENEDCLIELGATPEEQTLRHIHTCKGCAKKIKNDIDSCLNGEEMITYDDFSKLELRVAEIKEVKEVEGADKLLQLTIDVGEEKIIVAGIKKAYAPEELVGKQIIVVNNLEPVKLRGIMSNGMLLAASDGGPVLLTVDKPVKNGSKIS